jgi:hypothetical protein
MNAVTQLTEAIQAVAPIHGVASNRRIDFKDEATQQQRADAQAIADGWDFSDAATAQREILALRQKAAAALESQADLSLSIDRAIVKEMLAYTNTKLTAIADTLRSKNTITMAERNSFVNGLATQKQAFDAIKARLEAGQGD